VFAGRVVKAMSTPGTAGGDCGTSHFWISRAISRSRFSATRSANSSASSASSTSAPSTLKLAGPPSPRASNRASAASRNSRRVGESLRIMAQNSAAAIRSTRRPGGWFSSFVSSSRE